MSYSNPRITNPATKFIEFKGDTGEFFYYDKDKEQKIQLKMPLYFIVLDELSTITGFNNRLGCGIYSNEIRNIKDEVLNVRSFKGGLSIIGKYQDIKDKITSNGGKFCKSVYAMLITGKNQYELVNFKFHGASFGGVESGRSGWMQKKVNTEKYGVCVKECEQGQTGSIHYMAPIFEGLNINSSYDTAARNMDKELQKFLSYYFSQQVEKEVSELEPLEPEVIDENDPAGMGTFDKKEKMDVSDVTDLPFTFLLPIIGLGLSLFC